MVMANNTMKYMTRMGQKTGILNTEKNVQASAISIALVIECLHVARETRERVITTFYPQSLVNLTNFKRKEMLTKT